MLPKINTGKENTMILQRSDARRYDKLFLGFMDNVAPTFGLKSTPRFPCEDLTAGDMCMLLEGVWGPFGDRGIIDDFVSANPLRFNRTDLREIEGWRDALFADFHVVRDGRDTVFMYDDRSYVVRGVGSEAEVDLGLELPALCTALVIPFAGLLTHGSVVEDLPTALVHDDLTSRDVQEAIARQKAEGRRVSTAKDFARNISAVQASQQKYNGMRAEEDERAYGDGPAPEQYPGLLAGLSAEERAKAVEEHKKALEEALTFEDRQRRYQDLRENIKADCVDGDLAWTLAQAFDTLDEDDLLSMADRNGITREDVLADRSKLCKELARVCDRDPEALLGPAVMCGRWAVEEVKRVYDAGGLLTIPDVGDLLKDVPHPFFPCVQLFHRDNTFACIMPREVRDALTHADWAAQFERSDRLQEAYKYLDALQDMRGVVRMDKALEECFDHVDELNGAEVLLMIKERLYRGWGSLEVHYIDDERYFVESDIMLAEILGAYQDDIARGSEGFKQMRQRLSAEMDDIEGLINKTDHFLTHAILQAQEGKPPCPPSEDILSHAVAGAVMRTPEAQALVSYFDAHVPEGEDEYTFGTEAVYSVIDHARGLINFEALFGGLADMGFVPTEEQLEEMLPLIRSLDEVVPKWTNNGWAPRDLPLDEDRVHTVQFKEMSIPVRTRR